jgi:hypothetical protein
MPGVNGRSGGFCGTIKAAQKAEVRQLTARFVLMRPTAAPLIHGSMFIRGEIANAVVLSLLVGEIALAAFWLAHS